VNRRQIVVRTDDRVRLLSAVLAATNYPDVSQDRKKHGTHLHARGTRKLVAEYVHHPAVHAMQVLLDQHIPLASMYSYIMRLTYPALEAMEEAPRWVPPRWNEHLRHFLEVTKLQAWWANEEPQWNLPMRHLNEAFAPIDLYGFLEPFVGPISETLTFMPNISYPSDQNIGIRVGGELIAIIPPPIAWGDSPPWPYKDDPALAYRAALSEYGELLMIAYLRNHNDITTALAEKPLPVDEKFAARHSTWLDQFMGIFKAAVIAMFLEDSVSSLEARSFVQYMQKVEGLTILPGAVSVLRRYIDEHKAGRYRTFAEFLPNLPKHLRVAKTIAAL
jgi:hypothetical protein